MSEYEIGHLAIKDKDHQDRCASSSPSPSPSLLNEGTNDKPGMVNWLTKLDLKRQIAEIDAALLGIRDSIDTLNVQLTLKQDQREGLVIKLREMQQRQRRSGPGMTSTTTRTRRTAEGVNMFVGIDYMDGEFDWMGGLKARMRSVFGIQEFRLCQRG